MFFCYRPSNLLCYLSRVQQNCDEALIYYRFALLCFFCYRPLYPLKDYLSLKSSRADRNRQRKHRTSRTKPWASAPNRQQEKEGAPPTASQIQFSRSYITQTASAHTQMHPVGRTLSSEQGRGQQAPRRNPGQALENHGKMLFAYGFLFVYFFNFLL